MARVRVGWILGNAGKLDWITRFRYHISPALRAKIEVCALMFLITFFFPSFSGPREGIIKFWNKITNFRLASLSLTEIGDYSQSTVWCIYAEYPYNFSFILQEIYFTFYMSFKFGWNTFLVLANHISQTSQPGHSCLKHG